MSCAFVIHYYTRDSPILLLESHHSEFRSNTPAWKFLVILISWFRCDKLELELDESWRVGAWTTLQLHGQAWLSQETDIGRTMPSQHELSHLNLRPFTNGYKHRIQQNMEQHEGE